jgi:ornithine cyclodeaminase
MKDYKPDEAIMFNPMGMAVFDIALGKYYVDEALKKNVGKNL